VTTYNQLESVLGRASSNRFPPSLAPVNLLLQELRPQFGELDFFAPFGAIITLNTVPQKLTQFSNAKLKNDQLLPSALTNDITVVNPLGIGIRTILNVQIDTMADAHVILELYADDVATGIVFNFASKNQIVSQTEVVDLEAPDGTVFTFYAYVSAGSVDATLKKLSFVMEKIALYADSVITVVAAEPVEIYTIKNTDGTPITNTDGDVITS